MNNVNSRVDEADAAEGADRVTETAGNENTGYGSIGEVIRDVVWLHHSLVTNEKES